MRKMHVNVNNAGELVCVPPTIHVPPHSYEEIAVVLNKGLVDYYDLDISLDEDPTNALAKDKLSSSVTVIEDNNRAVGEAKFSITLTPWIAKSGDSLELDPRIVNE